MAMGAVSVANLAILILLASGVIAGGGWDTGYATFYGDMSGGETMQGACGYGDLFKQGYGLETAALSTVLFNNGLTCGACYELRCYHDPNWCFPRTITITATNFCPPNPTKPNDNGGWCNPPRKHFDLSMPMFGDLVKDYHAGIIPIQFQRVPCIKNGGVRFEIKGNPYWILVLVYNVAGSGDVHAVSVKGSKTGWMSMSRSWGQNWQTWVQLLGQSLSFRVMTSDERVLQSDNVVPANWQFGQNFEGKQFQE
ncbi:expansin-A8-like [Elaeis guineensis]|uniref:Expansin n=1 Tax=Elaeis guineensis var. tenera TaxID=51953 RepID=A0A6I9RCH9_ELAGV|nr:expansin-A9-like [Elaeis guineensis]